MGSEAGTQELELRDYLRVVWRRKGVIALTAVVVVGVALALSLRKTPVYEATAEVLVQTRPSEQIYAPEGNRVVDPQRAVDTEIKVLESQTVAEAVERELGRVPDVSAGAVGETDVIAVRARSTDKERAARDANVYAATYIEVRREQAVDDLLAAGQEIQDKIDDLQGQIDALPADDADRRRLQDQQAFYRQQLDQLQVAANISETGGAQLVSRAGVPGAPVSPQPLRDGILALAVGLVLGTGLAFLRNYLDDTIKTKEDVERATGGATVVGLIPAVTGWKDRRSAHLVTAAKPASPAAEAYRTLRTSVQFLALDREIRLLQVTSAAQEEGKTTSVANLAVAFAQAGRRVVLVDCDLRRPRVHQFFGLANTAGFTSLLLGTSTLPDALQWAHGHPGLAVLASGPPPPDPSELLASNRAAEVIDSLRAHYDLVLVDSPPVLPVTDPLVLSRRVDCTLLVASAGRTTKKALHRAVEMLQQVGAPLGGTILNGVSTDRGYGYGDAYGGYYHSDAPAPRAVVRS